MKWHRYILFLIVVSLVFSACDDFVEEDISDKKLSVLAPADGYASADLTINFWWNELGGAETYEIQIVQPSFSNVQKFIADTNVTGNRFDMTFLPGDYEWRIRAVNNGYQTSFVNRKFSVDSVISLSNQTLVLNFPVNNLVTNNSAISFSWDPIYSATEYRFRLVDSTSSSLVIDTLLNSTSLTLNLNESVFNWMVRAENQTSSTLYTQRTFEIDQTAPAASTVNQPQVGDTVSNPVTISWNPSIASIGDSLYIYSDSSLATIVFNDFFNTTSYDFTGNLNHRYYWRLKSIDAAGNISSFSTTYDFYIQ